IVSVTVYLHRSQAHCGVDLHPAISHFFRFWLAESDRERLASTLEQSTALRTLYAMGRELTTLWERSSDSSDELLARLQAWCRRAEESNISALQNFSRRLRSYA